MIQVYEVEQRDQLIEELYIIWRNAVTTTHLFLSYDEIEMIAQYVPEALLHTPHLIVAFDELKPIGFIGIKEHKIEMLFIAPLRSCQGIGKQLIQYGVDKYAVDEVCVNEQNSLAKGFYEHLGFVVYKRSEHDEQGNPYPILYMKR